MSRDIQTTIEVGVIVAFGFLLPGVLIVLAIDWLVRWLA